ncbi:MAG: S8 family peptidase [Halioglobus sp.]|nr:S8 family peptidase [Halioglobus sp.]
MRAQSRILSIALMVSLLLAACGGGGGGGGGGGDNDDNTPDPSPVPPPPPMETTFSLSGTLAAPGSQAVDSDTNDPTREAIGNNTLATAQPIGNPVTLGGYVNVPGAGAPGRSTDTGDVEDFFRVDLLAGQRITMLVADFQQADADLYLYDTQGNIIDFSIATGEVESLTIEEDGTFLVNASAFAGATNYILAIGNTELAGSTRFSPLDVIPWEAVVKYRDGAGGKASAAAALERGFDMRQLGGGPERYRLMALRARQVAAQTQNKRLGRASGKMQYIKDEALRSRWQTLLAIKSLRDDPMVEAAEPNYRVQPFATPDDEFFSLQWHYPLISLPAAWDTTTGDGVIVAVIDSGVLAGHPDLQGQFVDGFDFIQDPDNSLDGNGIDPDPTDPGAPIGGSSSFHGTHVSGTVAARGGNGIGLTGAAFGARVMPLRALGVDGGTTYDVGQAVRYAAGLPNDSGTIPQQTADIINLSLGGSAFSQANQDLFAQVRDAGIPVVAAAGNEAGTDPFYPASYDGVISVSAVDSQRRLASYSNRGPQVDVTAPGGDNGVDLTGDGFPDGVLSTGGALDDGGLNFVYSFLNGTSMAAPHVAGVLALMVSINPNLAPADIDALLVAGSLTEDLGDAGRDDLFGHGLINAQRAVLAALESIGSSPADSPRLEASTGTLNFGAAADSLDLVLRNGGKGDLQVQAIEVSEPWLQVQPVSANAAGLGDYVAAVDREGIAPGVYTATITIDSSVNMLSVRVFMSIGGDLTASDVGVVYILLLDTEDESVINQFVSGGDDGMYPFRFDGVEAGSYEIIAGSDADNDLFICDAGEACGAWLTIDQPIVIELDGDTGGVDFPVDYQVALPNLTGTGQPSAVTETARPLEPRRSDGISRQAAGEHE